MKKLWALLLVCLLAVQFACPALGASVGNYTAVTAAVKKAKATITADANYPFLRDTYLTRVKKLTEGYDHNIPADRQKEIDALAAEITALPDEIYKKETKTVTLLNGQKKSISVYPNIDESKATVTLTVAYDRLGTVKAGETVTVSVIMQGNYPVQSMTLPLVYDKLRLEPIAAGTGYAAFSPSVLSMYDAWDYALKSYPVGPNKNYATDTAFQNRYGSVCVALAGGSTHVSDFAQPAKLFTVTFRAKGEVSSTADPVKILPDWAITAAYRDNPLSVRRCVSLQSVLEPYPGSAYGQTIRVAYQHGDVIAQDSIHLLYRQSTALTVKAGTGKLQFVSQNPKVATVSAEGKVTATGRGTTQIEVRDANGAVLDVCSVQVDFAWWQWVIKIVLFGWLWY